VVVVGAGVGRPALIRGGGMRHPERTAAEIAEQQLERLIGGAHDEGPYGPDGDLAGSAVDVLVMGDDQRPYLVRRIVDGGRSGSRLCWVSVSTAGWTPGLCHPVVRVAVVPEPQSVINAPASASAWRAVRPPRGDSSI
jgi:hypothetical protein